jgi:cellulose synthase/poly-beta-1,6-N-acetylglucosamine synthase-like glycosyltransferase
MITVIQTCKNKDEYFQLDLEDIPGITEVLRPFGDNPSLQRNQALLKAKSDVILFLDDDSVIESAMIKKYIRSFEDSRVDIIGGPAIIRHEDKVSEVLGHILSSFFLIGPSASRYSCRGVKRRASEKELILCNLAIRKNALLDSGGFDIKLYPWEENELLNKMNKKGFESYYDPSIVTTRGMTDSLKCFYLKIFNYAMNRGKMGGVKSFIYALPCFILINTLYTLQSMHLNTLFLCYLLYLFISGLIIAQKTKKYKLVCLVPLITWGLHITYGVGLCYGMSLFLIRKCFRHFLNSSNRIDVLK